MCLTRCRWSRIWWSNIIRVDANWRRKNQKPLPRGRGFYFPVRFRSGGLAHRDAFFLQRLLQFAGLEHFSNNVAAADEFALDVELRDRRPVRIGLDAVAQVFRLQNI